MLGWSAVAGDTPIPTHGSVSSSGRAPEVVVTGYPLSVRSIARPPCPSMARACLGSGTATGLATSATCWRPEKTRHGHGGCEKNVSSPGTLHTTSLGSTSEQRVWALGVPLI